MENTTSINTGFSYSAWLQGANAQEPVTQQQTSAFFQNLMTSFNIIMQQDQDAAKRESDAFKDIYSADQG